MGKITDFNITFGDHIYPVYRPGETMFGTVSFNVTGEVKAKSVKLHLHGAAVTDWYSSYKETRARTDKSKEVYLSKAVTFLGGGGITVLKEGLHRYQYRFQLNNCPKFPSSYESGPGAVRYWLSFHVYRSGMSSDNIHTVPFTLITTLDVNDECYKNLVEASNSKIISKALGLGNAGELKLKASLDRGAYCPGENMNLTVVVHNASSKTLGSVRAFLVQSTWYSRSATEVDRCDTPVAAWVIENKLNKEELKKFTKPFEVPSLTASTQDESCKIIKVSYFLEVTVEVPWGLDLSLKLPVTIGTIPYGCKMTFMRFKAHSESNGSYRKQVPSTNNVCDRKCQKGFAMCLLEDQHIPFPRYTSFIPFTASIVPGSIAGPLEPGLDVVTTENPANTEVQTEKPTVLASSTSRNSASALPPYEAPPTYESLYASDRCDGSSSSDETSPKRESEGAAESVARTESHTLTWKGALIGLITSKNNLPKTKEFLNNNSKMLKKNDGRILAVFDEFQITPPDLTSAIFIVFDSEAQAAQWSDHLISANPVEDLQIFLAENSAPTACAVADFTLYPFVSLTMTHEDPTKKITQEQTEKQQSTSQNVFPSLRNQYGGKFILFASKAKLIAGDWTDRSYSPHNVKTCVTMWPTEKLFQAYVKDLNSQPDFQTYNEISKLTTSTIVSVKKLINEE